jgi:hypothetical protein
MRSSQGRVNGSLGATRGRVNGSPGSSERGKTNGDRGRTNGASSRVGPIVRRKPRRSPRALAATAVALLVVPVLLGLAAPHPGPRFAADGDFSEWAGVTAVADHDDSAPAAGTPDLTEVRVSYEARTLYVFAAASGAWFAGDKERVVRVFVDGDANAATGFDMGDLGADFMIEGAGRGGDLLADGLFTFEMGRDGSDWRGWVRVADAPLAVRSDKLEAAVPGPAGASARVVVAASSLEGDDLLDPPVSADGAFVVAQSTRAAAVLPNGEVEVPLVDLKMSADAGAHKVSAVRFAPSGAANFSVVKSARLLLGGTQTLDSASIDLSSISFSFVPPIALSAGGSVNATLLVSLVDGKSFEPTAGASFGARFAGADLGGDGAAVAVRPRALAPSSYLGYVSAVPVVDGAFGEWRLASAAQDPFDADAPAGGDLVGVRAMTVGRSGAFFAETRGPVLVGAALSELPVSVQIAAPPTSNSPPAGPEPAEPRAEAPPLSADDRLLVYLDTDRDPSTGFQPTLGGPVGAEYVIQVAGRFSAVTDGHLLKFAGSSSFESAWSPVSDSKAIAFGQDIEGEIPAAALAATGAARVLIQAVAWSGRTTDLSDALQDAVLAPVDPDHLLHFQSVTFDPLEGKPAVRPALLAPGPTGYWVVQLNKAPEAASLAALESAGATLYGYVHSNAYLAKMDEATAATVLSMPEVRWVGVYEPAFKFPVDPASWGEGPLNLVALLFERPHDLQARVEAAGAMVLSATDAALRVRINGSDVEGLGFIPEIQFVDLEHTRVPLNDVGRRFQGVNLTYDRHGLNGTGIVVGISDSGIDFTHPAFDDTGTSSPNFDGRIVGYFKYAGSYGDSDGHGTHTAGSVAGDGDLSDTANNSGAAAPGQFRGMAPAAKLVETEIFDGGTPGDDGVFADQQAYGATVSSNSWGYVDNQQNSITDYETSAYLTDLSVIDSNTSRSGLQPMTIVFAAGNDGPSADSAGSPGTAKNVITVGASETDRGYDMYSDNSSSIASFSSRGPTDDGRIRPDVVAVGTYVLSSQSRTSGCTCTYGGWDQSWTGANYAFSSGTSQATPQVAGIAALFQQFVNQTYGRIPSPALVKAALINGAEDLGYGYEYTTGVTGPMSQGWGRVNITRATDGPPNGTIILTEEGPVVSAGDVIVHRYVVSNASTPLKVTVVWTDMPGNPVDTATFSELVNDLDLVVRAPNGSFYHGNKFGGAWSRLNNSSYDRLNNVENVFVQTPSVGTWTVEVAGFALKSAQQKFALAVSGNLTERGPPSVADAHTVPGAPSGSRFGWNATASGSINGDSYRDLVVGAPGANGGNGSVYIFFGWAGGSYTSFSVSSANVTLSGTAAEGFGSSLDTSGDFDSDGKNDLIIGAPGGGKAYLYKGAASWASRTPDITFAGNSTNLFGAAVRLAAIDSAAGAEAIVGAPLTSNATGSLFIFSGGGASGTWNASSANGTLTGAANGSRLGTSISAGDADGDSKLDLAVGAPGAAKVRMARGGAAAASIAFNATVTGIPGTAFGQCVAMEGDLNGDGKADLVVGAPLANNSAGASYVFFGRSPLGDEQVIRYYFFDDMESGEGLWQEMSVGSNASTSWSLSSSTYYGDAGTGHAWQDSSGNYAVNQDISIAFKDGISLSAATHPLLTFVYRADLEEVASNYDGFMVLYSTNSGSTWTQLDSTNTQGLYDALGYDPTGPPSANTAITDMWAFTYDRFEWRQVAFNVSSLAGSSSVKFRIEFVADSLNGGDGIYIDDVAVREANMSSPNLTVYGDSAGDRFGWSVAAPGDMSGDGRSEFAVGAPFAPNGLTSAAGAAYVFVGSSALNGTAVAPDAAEVLHGLNASENLGWSLASISGFNGSSHTYLFAGAPGTGSGAGGARIGDASAPIPEFSQVAFPMAAVAGIVMFGRLRRRRSRA